jgi:DNA polymerase III subunit epsilon
MSLDLTEVVPFDTESTGTDVDNDRIVSATVAHVQPGAEPIVTSHMIAVDVDIPAEATEVHGITTEQARATGKPAPEVLEAVAADLAWHMAAGRPVVGMNLGFDFSLLDAELRRHNLPTLPDRLGRGVGPCIDIFVLDKAVDRYRPGKRKLVDLCGVYGVRHDGAHDATEDALAAARVAWRMAAMTGMGMATLRSRYAARPRQAPHIAGALIALGQMSLTELHDAQKGWYREQATGLAAYWRQKANELEHEAARLPVQGIRDDAAAEAEKLRAAADSVSLEWPMRPFGGAA